MTFVLSGPAFVRPPGVAEKLAGFIQSRVEQNPEVRCIEVNQAGERISRTIAELHRRALQILPMLRDRVTAGESDVVLCFENVLDFVPAVWACIYGGYSCLPWHLAKISDHDQETDFMLSAIGQRLNHPVLLTTDGIESRIIRRAGALFRTALCIDRELPDQSREASPAEMPSQLDAAGDAAFLVPTSGTTAAAKIAIIEHQCSLNRFLALRENLYRSARIWCFPFDGITGMRIVFPGLADTIYLQPGRLAAQPLELLKLVEEFRLESFGVSSSLLARILDATEFTSVRPNLSSLKHVGLGAETVVPDVVRRLGLRFRKMGAVDLQVSFGYGMTETGLICHTERLAIDQALDGNGDPLSVGRCVPGWSLRIVDEEGTALPPEAAGNIEVWSDRQLFSGYRNDPDQNDRSFAQDGWFRTEDIGVVEAGALTIMGRQKATIIVNGKKFSLESIEAPLRSMEGIRRLLAAAAPVRRDDSSTDELAVFFVPRDDDKAEVDGLCRRILHEIGRHAGIPVKHLVPVSESEFPVTTTGKIRRDELVRLYQSSILAPHILARSEDSSAVRALTETESRLVELWEKILKLESPPALEDSLFELGGDSLASAELIFAVEEKFSCELPIEAFFQRPTISTMTKLIAEHATTLPSNSSARSAEGGYRLLHKLQSYTGSWPGERLFADSLVVGVNVAGTRTPLFWVCQERDEFLQLAKHLGPDQPLYGMRSCVGIVGVKDYSTDVLETVCNRYLWEILALPVRTPFFVGGNCQGGIFALALARRLKQIGRSPSLLILMEWMYSYGRYTQPTLLLYGDQSHTAAIYREPARHSPNWREDFPERTLASIPGTHGQFFGGENVTGLAEVLRRHLGSSASVRPA